MIRRVALIALAVAGVSGIAAAARADEASAQAVWKKYWMAIEVQKICNKAAFSQSQYDNMVHRINERVNYDLGAGVLHQIMGDAKTDAFDLTFKYGCSSPDVRDYLSLYSNDLAPIAGQ
jgi:hypothetical protein